MKVDLVSRNDWMSERHNVQSLINQLKTMNHIAEDYVSILHLRSVNHPHEIETAEQADKFIDHSVDMINNIMEDNFFTECDRCGEVLDQLLGEDFHLEKIGHVVCHACLSPKEKEELGK
jgi:formylmethanofuran dehydrogenase subunit E